MFHIQVPISISLAKLEPMSTNFNVAPLSMAAEVATLSLYIFHWKPLFKNDDIEKCTRQKSPRAPAERKER